MSLSSTKKNKIIVITGPTAVGKTDLAIATALKLNTDILNFDSRQFYKELNIGVAKPSPIQLAQVKHNFIDCCSIHDRFDIGMFEKNAIQFLDNFFETKDVIIATGGSGLYLDALMYGVDELPEIDLSIRHKLEQEFIHSGIESLQNQLKQVDIDYYNSIDSQNKQRVIRALEVFYSSGKKMSCFHTKMKKDRNFEIEGMVLLRNRDELYKRIEKRVDIMMQDGLLHEVESLIEYRDLNALKTVGYKELFDYFDGNCSLNEAINKIKQHTRNYAKRQITWFKKYTQFSIQYLH
jgi:tRNA dimethylallyltransferase